MSTNWVVVKDVEESFDPYGFAAMRFSVAALALIACLPKAFKCGTTFKAGIELGVWTALGYITQGLALMLTDASRASFLSTFTVICVPIIAGIRGRGINKSTWIAAAAAMVGVALLEQGGSPMSFGDVWGLASAVFFAVQMYRTEHHTRNLPREQSMPLMAIIMATVAIVTVISAIIVHPQQALDWVEHL